MIYRRDSIFKVGNVLLIVLVVVLCAGRAYAQKTESAEALFVDILKDSQHVGPESVVAILPIADAMKQKAINRDVLEQLVVDNKIKAKVLSIDELSRGLKKNSGSELIPSQYEKEYVQALIRQQKLTHLLLSKLEIIDNQSVLTTRLFDVKSLSVLLSRYVSYPIEQDVNVGVRKQVEKMYGYRDISKNEFDLIQCSLSVNLISCDMLFKAESTDSQYIFENLILFNGDRQLANTVATVSVPSLSDGYESVAFGEVIESLTSLNNVYLSIDKYVVSDEIENLQPIAILDYSINNIKYRIIEGQFDIHKL